MKQVIVDDIRRVARSLEKELGDELSRTEYLNNGAHFSHYDIYDGGTDWAFYCKKAGFKTKTEEAVPDEVYLSAFRGLFMT